jgi:hypothetical protein
MSNFSFPDGKRFAFTIIDDTDASTVDNTRPFYDLLYKLKIGATKTVWPVACPEGSKNFGSSQTLADPAYLAFTRELDDRGFEISWHSATMESSERIRVIRALEFFKSIFGHYPRVHANHAFNRENIYWGSTRFDHPFAKYLTRRLLGIEDNYFQGEVEGSPYYWGDLCQNHIRYARNLTFNSLDISRVNPTLPYRDPLRPLVPYWFSATDIEDAAEFVRRLTWRKLLSLETNGGVCIVATHVGKGYVRNGKVRDDVRAILQTLSERSGWYPTVGTLLDHLKAQHDTAEISQKEWRRMQWQWLIDLSSRKLSSLRTQFFPKVFQFRGLA